jgi:ATP-binding cassette, subfamily B, bacterial
VAEAAVAPAGARPIGTVSSLRLMFATAAESDRRGLVGGIAMLMVATLLQPLFPLLFGRMVDVVGRQPPDLAAAGVAAATIAVTSAGAAVGINYSQVFLWNVWEQTAVTLDRRLVALAGRIASVADAGRDEYLENLTLVRRNRESLHNSAMGLLQSFGMAIQIAITVAILVRVEPLLLLLPIFAVAPVLASRAAEKRWQAATAATSSDLRRADGSFGLALEPRSAGELRTLALRDHLLARHRAGWDRMVADMWRAQVVGNALLAAALTLFTLAFGAAILLVARQAVDGDATLGEVIIVITAGQQLHGQIGNAAGMAGALFRVVETMRRFAAIARYADAHAAPAGAAAPAPAVREGIRLAGVRFRYPGAERHAVNGVDTFLPAGSVVALVGDNGAGKSTLVSLLLGLQRPDTGRITVDGVDLADLDLDRWREGVAAAFQDFVRYELLAREAVGVGDVARIDDAAAVRASLVRADVADLEDELADGLDTPLGRAFHEGIDLSGGQWQKVALARSMMREAPLVLALDEPTYSLDVESERRVYDWFSRVAREENPHGTITVIVSHRFSTVRSADLVAVMDDGRLVEWGSHDELLAAGGRYAEMYRMQAEGYR